MLRLDPFELHQPETLTVALELLRLHTGKVRVCAGGSDLLPKMKRGQFEPTHLVSLDRLPELREIELPPMGGMEIGAMVTLRELSDHFYPGQYYPGLHQALGAIATPEIRTVGTIGGNLLVDTRCNYYDQSRQWRESLGFCLKKSGDTCWVARQSPVCLAISSSDLAPILCALEAAVEIISPTGSRRVLLREFYQGDGIKFHVLEADEILTRVVVPPRSGKSGFRKLRPRESFDFSNGSVAISWSFHRDGTFREIRAFVGGVASRPIELTEACQFLVGQGTGDAVLDLAAERVSRQLKILDNGDMVPFYRKQVMGRFFRDILTRGQ